jgi:demethylmenaquinone methyltransferase/2-methoxy-6-polyprenyl-1,4-benzoquinol methylase
LQSVLLAEAVGAAGRVTGIDICPAFLRRAGQTAREAGMSEQLYFREGDAARLPFENGVFDWSWSSDCVGYSPSLEPLSAVRELARVVIPGGSVALFAWSSEKLLPGYPALEARLDATASGMAPFSAGMPPGRHFLRALGWLREAGLVDCAVRTFAGEAHAPLDRELRDALTALFAMRWPGAEAELPEEYHAEYRRLCLPESPDFIVKDPDYYAFFTWSLFHGRVAS